MRKMDDYTIPAREAAKEIGIRYAALLAHIRRSGRLKIRAKKERGKVYLPPSEVKRLAEIRRLIDAY